MGALHIRKPSPVQVIIDKIIVQMERNWAGASNPTYTLDVTWVRGHSGVKGNGRVDCEAKEVAKGRSSQKRNLLKFLTKAPLPKSISVQWQEFTAVCIIQGMRLFILKKNKCLMNAISLSILHRMI